MFGNKALIFEPELICNIAVGQVQTVYGKTPHHNDISRWKGKIKYEEFDQFVQGLKMLAEKAKAKSFQAMRRRLHSIKSTSRKKRVSRTPWATRMSPNSNLKLSTFAKLSSKKCFKQQRVIKEGNFEAMMAKKLKSSNGMPAINFLAPKPMKVKKSSKLRSFQQR